MTPNLHAIYKEMTPRHAPEGFLDGVFAVIALRERRRLLIRVPLILAGLALSAGSAFTATWMTITQASESGLGDFLFALASDTGAVLSVWESYGLAVLEAIPTAPLAGILASTCAFLLLLRSLDGVLSSRKVLARR